MSSTKSSNRKGRRSLPSRADTFATSSIRDKRHIGSRTNRHLTCSNCRLRKTRCDGSQPECKTCEVYQDECRYDKPPPMTQILAMSKRLQECERLIEAFTKASAPSEAASSMVESRDRYSVISSSPGIEVEQNSSIASFEPARLTLADVNKVAECSSFLSDLSLDEKGELCYYGPTSAVYDPPMLKERLKPSSENDLTSSEETKRTNLLSKAIQSREWEDIALGTAAIELGFPKDVLSELLQLHWTWIAPMFMWVYRPSFMRDMTTGGPYYSQFLITVLCAHASRFQEDSVGPMLIARARLLLGSEIQKPSSIPTVQALLQLSARDLAFGFISQAWLYSGMAFRMVSDLGLHHSSGKLLDLGKHSTEDLEIRRRLFWSCYFWDKAISLYLGRMPTLTELPFDHVPVLCKYSVPTSLPSLIIAVDHFTEHEPWIPYYSASSNSHRGMYNDYPFMRSHAISCFENSCKLAVILNDIILELYCRNPQHADGKLQAIRERLDYWRAKSPAHLQCHPESLPEICPPPHIVTQNLLYYTTIILLHRPFYSSPIHHKACCDASDNIERLLILIEGTFGFTRITYLMAYCVYTAASVRVRNVNAGYVDADSALSTFLRALRGGCTTCPILQRSLDIINNSLSKSYPENNESTSMSADTFGSSYLPAFPSYNTSRDLTETLNLGSMDSSGFLSLDYFPEAHIGTTTNDWYIPA